MVKAITLLPLMAIVAMLPACSQVELKEALRAQTPSVSLSDQRITQLDFEQVTLAFGIKVDNPNPIGINLAGLDYDLKLAGNRFIAGTDDKKIALAASGPSRIELPLTLSLADIKKSLEQLKGQDEVPYELTTGLLIDIPLLGKVRYPVTTSGVFPVPQLPSITVKRLSLSSLSLSGAAMLLDIEVDNPNAFGLALNRLSYDLTVNGKHWASGNQLKPGHINQNQKNIISLPLNLNFRELGSGLYSLLNGDSTLNYKLAGTLDANSDHRLIGNFKLPLDSSGTIKLTR